MGGNDSRSFIGVGPRHQQAVAYREERIGWWPRVCIDFYMEVSIHSKHFLLKDNKGWEGGGIQSRAFK